MHKLLLFLCVASACLAQQDTNKLKVIPAANGSAVGEVQFQNKANTHHVGLASPDVTTADHTFRLPAADTSGGGFVVTDGAYNLNVTPVTGIAMPTVLLTAGCDPTGATDSTSCLNTAFAAAAGAAIRVPSTGATGFYSVSGTVTIPANVYVLCDAGTTLFKRTGSITSGFGWFDIPDGTGVAIDGCSFDGQTTTPAGMDRANLIGGIPTYTSTSSIFTDNSSIWVHGGSLTFKNSTVQHSAGYPLILDARTVSIDNVFLSNLTFQYNRSFLFGSPGDETYGSWQGGVFIVSASTFGVHSLKLIDSTFKQNTGHAFFMDARNGNSLLNSNIKISGNIFKTIGLDFIELSGVTGFQVANNTGDHVGFVSTSDSDLVGTAKWYNNASGNVPAVAFDHASLVVRGTIANNTVKFVNGGCIDGDGLGGAKIAGNDCTNPLIGDVDYDGTVAGQMGPAVYSPSGITSAGQNWNYGYNAGNSNGNTQAENNLSITDNSFYGLGCSIKMYGARNSLVSGNTLTIPGNSNGTSDHNFCAPITLGTIGTGSNQQANAVTVTKNKITYSGSGGINAAIEDAQYGAFVTADVNRVFDNDLTGPLAQFSKDINSSSVEYGGNSTTTSGVTSAGYNLGISQHGSTAVATFRNQIELGTGIVLSRFYSGATPTTTSNLILSLSSNGRTYLGNGTTTGGLYWGATPLIDETQDSWFHSLNITGNLAIDNVRNSYLNSITDTGTSTLTLDSARNSRVNSLSIGTGAVANSTAGLAVDNLRNTFFNTVFIGVNGSSPLKAIDASNNHTGIGFWGGSSVTGANQFVATTTSGTGCTTLLPCINMGNVSNFVQSNAASTVSFAAPMGIGGTVNATGLGALSGSGSLLCLDGSGFIRSSLCPAATAPLLLGSTSFTGSIPLEANSAGAFDDVHDYSPVIGLLGAGATSQTAVLEYFHPYAYETLRRESGIVGGAVSSSSDANWESNGVTGMCVSNAAFTFGFGGGHHVGCNGGAFYGLVNATNAQAWGVNIFVSDVDRSLATSVFDYSHNHAGSVVGAEFDQQVGNTGSSVSSLNMGVAYLGITHTNLTTQAVNINLTGSAANYWDYGYITNDGAAIVGLHIGHGNVGYSGSACTTVLGSCTGAAYATNSQFIDIVSGPIVSGLPSTPMITRMWNDVNGQFNIITNQCPNPPSCSSGNAKFIRFTPIGNILIDGTASQASITATAGWVQSGDGFHSASSSGTALNLPSGGFTTLTGAITSTNSFNALDVTGGGIASLYSTVSGTLQNSLNVPNGGGAFGGVVFAGNQNTDIDAGNKLELLGQTGVIGGNVYFVVKNDFGNKAYMGMTGGSGGGAFFGSFNAISLGIRTSNTDRIQIDASGNINFTSASFSTFQQAVTFNSGIIMGSSGISAGGHAGFTGTLGVRNFANTGTCTMDFAAGIFYGSSGC
jgi:hypothetical protein